MAIFSRRHFEFIADYFATTGRDTITREELAVLFSRDNSRFDPVKFMDACGPVAAASVSKDFPLTISDKPPGEGEPQAAALWVHANKMHGDTVKLVDGRVKYLDDTDEWVAGFSHQDGFLYVSLNEEKDK